MMLESILPPELLRRYLLRGVPDGPFRDYLSVPLPGAGQPLSGVELLALDFETTGLDARHEAILSIGYVVVRDGRVILRERAHQQVQVNTRIPEDSVVIHHITEERARRGEHLSVLMPGLLQAMAGRVLLVHHAAIERGFLNAACRKLYGHPIPIRCIDTLAIEKRRLNRRQQSISPGQLRLFNLREHYGLPRYRAHIALQDAIATAELFLVQLARMGGDSGSLRLRNLLD